jgi:glycerol-3-phosphate acyltransferase PlsY
MLAFYFCLTAYLAGSINFSILAGKLAGRDIRRCFSGNPGTTNVYRVLGVWWAAGVLLMDVGRGLCVALIGAHAFEGPWPLVLGCLSVLVGNIFPIFHGFSGGKGVATTLGVYLGLNVWASLVCAVIWFGLVLGPVRRASVGSLTVVVVFPVLLIVLGEPGWLVGFAFAVGAVIAWTHRANIRRLIRGEEPLIKS